MELHVLNHFQRILDCFSTKELYKLAGNGMAMRSLYVALIVGLKALNPAKVQRYMQK